MVFNDMEGGPPETIYLQPDCPNCGPPDAQRQWCEDNIWDWCRNCGEELEEIKYVLSSDNHIESDFEGRQMSDKIGQMVIFKYALNEHEGPINHIEMPQGAEIINVQAQNDTPTIWAKVDKANEYETRTFAVVGTGKDFGEGKVPEDDEMEYLDSCICGRFVWHIHEVKQ